MTEKQIFAKLDLLIKNNKKGYPFSACVKYKNKLYFAVNEVFYKKDPTAHAEIQAIRLTCKKEKTHDLKSATIYSSHEPCPMCLTAIAWANIKNIRYIYNYKTAKSNNEYYKKSSKEVNSLLDLNRIIKQKGEKRKKSIPEIVFVKIFLLFYFFFWVTVIFLAFWL